MQEFINKRTIIVGEVNTGKTAYLGEILKRFLKGGESEIALIDMAPESIKGIGGKMSMQGFDSVRYYTAQISAPRLAGNSLAQTEALAMLNRELIEGIFEEYRKNPSKTLFINDVSLYLQSGDLHTLILFLDFTPTVIMNGYYGFSLGGGKLGNRERHNMEELLKRCDTVIRI